MGKTPTEHAHINNFAIRCFRDTGDGDYIAARMAFRARLFQQFLWSAEQAIEKYLKCVLMLNRKKADFGHQISTGLSRVNSELPFKITLSPQEERVFERIAAQDADRYLTLSYFIEGTDLPWFDAVVWKLRQYCQPLDIADIYSAPSQEEMNKGIMRIERLLAEKRPSAPECAIEGGFIEEVISKKGHPAREHLLWHNLYFTTRRRSSVRVATGFTARNSPFWLKPELLDEVAKYMYIPKAYIRAYKERAARVAEERAKG
nr:HEPN domain-containing protein [Herbaspirillum sp. ASV7]